MPKEVLEARVGRLLRQRGLTLATAESCSGGLLGHRLTNVSGSSDYYLGGVISYHNRIKTALLNVEPAVLEREGAVSNPVARQMARGVSQLMGADIGIGITGIAGPSGGTAEKPVGLVFIALVMERYEHCERYIWPYDRVGNKDASVERALQMTLEILQGED
jgi:PncC family amidohydrolase